MLPDCRSGKIKDIRTTESGEPGAFDSATAARAQRRPAIHHQSRVVAACLDGARCFTTLSTNLCLALPLVEKEASNARVAPAKHDTNRPRRSLFRPFRGGWFESPHHICIISAPSLPKYVSKSSKKETHTSLNRNERRCSKARAPVCDVVLWRRQPEPLLSNRHAAGSVIERIQTLVSGFIGHQSLARRSS